MGAYGPHTLRLPAPDHATEYGMMMWDLGKPDGFFDACDLHGEMHAGLSPDELARGQRPWVLLEDGASFHRTVLVRAIGVCSLIVMPH